MAKIGFEIGMTMHLGNPSNNEYLKMTMRVDEVDTELDFEEQIQKIHATAHQLMTWSEEQIGEKMLEKLGK